jgi:4-amino-4-deoxy-L-arabinose transferase-like glycosyltransferase
MISRRLQLGLCAATALALGIALRLWFVDHAARIAGDSLIYGNIAKNWLLHGVYGFAQSGSGPVPTLIRLPGYPLFLVACFRLFGLEHYTAVMYVQCAIDLLTCLLVSALAGRLLGRRAAMATLWLSALCPFTASYVSAPLTETPSLACIALTFYGLERWRAAGLGFNRWLWITSAAMAYAVLLRPEQGLLPAAVVPAMLWMALRSRGPRSALLPAVAPVLLAAVCIVLPLAPWAVRNWRTFHVFEPLAPRYATDPGETVPLGFQRWYRTWAIDFASTDDVYWNYDGANIEISDLPTRAFDSDDQYARTDALLAEYNQTSNATPAFDARFEALAEERIQADPLRYYIALPVARLIDMLLRPRTEMLPVSLEWWKWSEHPGQSAFAAAFAGLNLVYFVLGGVGLWLWRRRRWDGNPALAWATVGFVVLRCALLLTLDNSEPRYTLEFFPVVMIWSAVLFSRGSQALPGEDAGAPCPASGTWVSNKRCRQRSTA